MNFEPQKFFVGLIDFFSILLPGAVLAFLLKDYVGPLLLGVDAYSKLEGTQAGLVFLFASYLLGHFLFLIGSWLDDFAYDPVRKSTDKEQIARLLNGRELSPRFLRDMARLFFKTDPDAAVDQVVQIKEGYLKRMKAPGAVNAFQWCKARLALEKPEALAIVNRFEADSKFFRSFVPVLAALLAVLLVNSELVTVPSGAKWELAAGAAVFLVLAFWRYMEQRFKATQQAYWFILTLEAAQKAQDPAAKPPTPVYAAAKPDAPTHAGGVVFRKRSGQTECLLVQATKNPEEWVLPKGHIEPGEEPKRSAIREVREETGVWARVEQDLKVVEYTSEGELVKAEYYLMALVEEGQPADPWREHKWLPLTKALVEIKLPESQEVLRRAEQSLISNK